MKRLKLLLLLPLLLLDCLANFLQGGSIRSTLSSDAWYQRDHKYWRHAHVWIDWLFSCPAIGHVNHCMRAAANEERYGSAWASWAAKWNT